MSDDDLLDIPKFLRNQPNPEDTSTSGSNGLLCGSDKLPLSHDDLIITFHRLWTECVGAPGYDKKAWKSVREQISNVVCVI